MSHFAQAERGALCDLLLAVGPGGPTLCEGWTTGDLAAHLVVRERRPDAAAGVVVPGLGRYTERVQRWVRDGEPWESLVGRVRAGPPAAMRPIDEAVNLVEYFVHHEDVRRASAGWEPRSIDAAEEASLWGRVRQMGRLLGRHSPIGLAVNAPGYGQATVKGGTPAVTVLGAPGELVLLLFGRGAQARVTFEGDEVSIGRLRHTSFGL